MQIEGVRTEMSLSTWWLSVATSLPPGGEKCPFLPRLQSPVLAFVDGTKAGESRLFPQEGDKGVIVANVPFILSGSAPGSRIK